MQEEIYDDTSAIMAEEPKSNLDAIRKRFEGSKAPPMGMKPPVKFNSGPKPVVTPKSVGVGDSGRACNGSVANNVGVNKTGSAIVNNGNKEDAQKKDAGIVGGPKRNSKVNIPDAFRTSSESPPVASKPQLKPGLSPKPKNDTNNNASNNTASTTTPGKFNLKNNKFAQKTEPETINAKPSYLKGSNATNKTVQNNESPKPAVGAKPNSPRGVNVLATSMDASDLKAKLKPVTQRKTSDTSQGDSSEIELRNKLNKFGNKASVKRKSVKASVIRTMDGKKFLKVETSTLNDSGPAPEKPELLDFEIDLEALIEDFNKALQVIGE